MGQRAGNQDGSAGRTASNPSAALGRAGPAQLVERLATFLKACFLYPDHSQRVRLTSAAVLEVLRAQLERRPMVDVVVGSHDLVVLGSRVPGSVTGQAWLRDLFVQAHIGGLEFTPAVDGAALLAAARRLQSARAGNERGLRAWQEPIAGVRARDLVLRGGHAEGPDDDQAHSVSGASGPRARALAAALRASDRVRARLDELQELLAGDEAPADAKLDIVAELVRCLPAEANDDHAYAEGLAERVLDSICQELRGVAAAPLRRAEIAPLFVSIGKKLFTASVANALPPPPPAGGRGHGDEAITDDLDLLLAELRALEAQLPSDAPPAVSEGAAEVVGLVLHTVTTSGAGRDGAAEARLAVALADGNPAARTCVCEYFERALAGADPDRRPTWRVVPLASEPAVRQALRSCGLLEPEFLARHFPHAFGLFLDTLDGQDASGRLLAMSQLLAPGALARSAAWFDRHPEEFADARADRLLAAAQPPTLPLAALAIRHAKQDVKAQAARVLRQLALPGPASVALRVIDPPSRLPREYLEQVCLWGGHGPPDAELASMSGVLTRSYINSLAGQPDQEARRIFAIRALAELPSTETRVLLKDLLTANRGFSLWKRESRAVRRVARQALHALAQWPGGSP